MEKRTFRLPYDIPTDVGEVNNGEVITVPDQSLSVKEILYRFTNGLPLDVPVRHPNFDDEETFDESVAVTNTPIDIDNVVDIINNPLQMDLFDNDTNPDLNNVKRDDDLNDDATNTNKSVTE